LSLLGDVTGQRVLDAACGPGLCAAELIDRGAQVVGFDQSPRMVQICRERVGQGEFRVHDLADPLSWLPDGSVDLVLCALGLAGALLALAPQLYHLSWAIRSYSAEEYPTRPSDNAKIHSATPRDSARRLQRAQKCGSASRTESSASRRT
jgi:SAM-dependent methyltransferase